MPPCPLPRLFIKEAIQKQDASSKLVIVVGDDDLEKAARSMLSRDLGSGLHALNLCVAGKAVCFEV